MKKSESKYFNTAVKFDRALLALLERKPFEYITIIEVCEEAKVNRSTFYLHYDNMHDLLFETIEYFVQKFNQSYDIDVDAFIQELGCCEIANLNFITEQYLMPFLAFVEKHQKIIDVALSQMNSIQLDEVFKRFNEIVFDPILERFDYPVEQRQYVMKFYLNGLAAILREWINDECRKSYEEICEIIQNCIFGKDNRYSGLIHSFQRYRNGV